MKIGFDNKKYVEVQSKKIKERIDDFDKLYLEIGGKLFDDYHAARVLPGFEPDSKMKMLLKLKDITEIIICISAKDIERKRMRADYGITYDMEVLRLIGEFQKLGLSVNSVVITLYNGEESSKSFIKKLEENNIKVYVHTPTAGYPTDVEKIVSDEGYGANSYIETTKKLVVVTAPGPASGKLATCLSQLYHEYKRGVRAGYAKYETFPVWNLPLKHPINMAYEAATADIKDVNMIDSFHLEKYGVTAVNYNRDLEVFPILKSILYKIIGQDIYYSPTDMGVNMIGYCISDDDLVCKASRQEIIRRYYTSLCDYKKGIEDKSVCEKLKLLMNELNIDPLEERKIINISREKAMREKLPVVALELEGGKIITGKKTKLLSPVSSLVLNFLKEISGIKDSVDLLSDEVLEPILKLKPLSNHPSSVLDLGEVLIALSICSVNNEDVKRALENLSELSGLEAHASFIVDNEEFNILKRLRVNLTCEPIFYLEKFFV